MRIETYQVIKYWYRHRLQNKHTRSCNNYNFKVLKLQFVALSSPYPRRYCKTYPRPHDITVKMVPVPAVLPLCDVSVPISRRCPHHRAALLQKSAPLRCMAVTPDYGYLSSHRASPPVDS